MERLTKEAARHQQALINKGTREAVKATALRLLKNNPYGDGHLSQRKIADISGCSVGTVNTISQKLNENLDLSADDLKELKRGRKRNDFTKIPQIDYEKISDIIHTKSPRDCGLDGCVWSGPLVQKLLEKECAIQLGVKDVDRFMERMGYTSKFAYRVNPKMDDEEVAFFKAIGFFQVCLVAVATGMKIYFVDQSHVQKSYHVRGYAKKGKRARLSHSTRLHHSPCSFLSIIGFDGSCFMVCHMGYFDAGVLAEYLDQFLKLHRGEDILLFLDNHSMHWSYELLDWQRRRSNKYKNGKIEFAYFPKYAPKLNPVEYLNNILKDELRKSGVQTMEELIAKAKKMVERYNTNTDEMKKLIRSCFSAPECSYTLEQYNRAMHDIEELKAAGEW